MITLGKITTNYQTLEMGFRDHDGKKVVLRGMSTGAPRTVSAKRMERIFRHGEVAYVVRVFDHYAEGFRGSTTVSYRDQEFVGMTSTGF
jgi:hypothetical protein